MSRFESPFWNIKAGTNLIRNVSWHTRCVHAHTRATFIREDHRLAHYSCALISVMRFMKLMVDQRNSELLLIRVMSFVSCRAFFAFYYFEILRFVLSLRKIETRC